jgi:predicted nucleic acid-binding protein
MLLDSTFLVDLMRGDPGARALLEAIEAGSEAARIPSPALAKLWEGAARSRHPPREAERLRDLLLAMPQAPFAGEHAVACGRILAAAERAGAALDPFDAMVAAVASVDDETLVTRNARDFERIEGVRIRTY